MPVGDAVVELQLHIRVEEPVQAQRDVVQEHGSKTGYTSECVGSTPPDPILPAFTEAGRARKPRPEPASITTSSPATERASGSEKLRFCCFRTTPAVAEAGRGHKTIARKSLYKTRLTYTDQM